MPGCSMMCTMPTTASTMNHSTITGPNRRPTAAVPKRCITNRPINAVIDSGSTQSFMSGETTSSPSIAPSTVMAGVMTLSP
jgi:hypothetical protein